MYALSPVVKTYTMFNPCPAWITSEHRRTTQLFLINTRDQCLKTSFALDNRQPLLSYPIPTMMEDNEKDQGAERQRRSMLEASHLGGDQFDHPQFRGSTKKRSETDADKANDGSKAGGSGADMLALLYAKKRKIGDFAFGLGGSGMPASTSYSLRPDEESVVPGRLPPRIQTNEGYSGTDKNFGKSSAIRSSEQPELAE